MQYSMISWSDYPILLAAAETGNLTAAGRKLNLSQPTVGRRIRALEDHFGTPLLTRDNGILVPTDFGHSMIDHIRRMEEEASAITRSSATLETSLAGVVRLAASEGIGTHWLPPVMQHFRQNHPDILLDLGIGFRDFNLAQREADIALRWMNPGDQNSLIGRKVATVTFGLFASKHYIENSGPLNAPEDLENHDGVMATIMDGKVLWITDSRGEPVHLPKRITFRSNSIWAFDEAILSGYGIGALPICGIRSMDSNIVRVLPNISRQEDLYLVAHEDLKRSRRIRAVFDFLVECFKNDSGFFLNGTPSIFESELAATLCCGGHPELDAAE